MNINIAKDFYRAPAVRYISEGPGSGEQFRKDILLPKLKEAIESEIKLVIELDGSAGLGTSFLEESFGGLIREEKISYDAIINTITFISVEEPDYIEEINEYLIDARDNES